MNKVTEQDSNYDSLDKMNTSELLRNMNEEDKTVAVSVQKQITQIKKLIDAAFPNMSKNGRLFYLGAGTSGRLGILDASECPPTYGVAHGKVVGLIAGGDTAIRKAVEDAEDDYEGGWKDLQKHDISSNDFVIGIAASGTTPYVVGALEYCQKNNIQTGCITCNPNSPLSEFSDYPIEVIVGPEFVTGSTRMKSGTAQKLVLNMISTSLMIKMGHVKGNKMVDMQLNNNKLVKRGITLVQKALNISYEEAKILLNEHKSVRKSIDSYNSSK